MRQAVLLIAIILSAGCATPSAPIKGVYVERQFPALGETVTQELGDTLVQYQWVAEVPSFSFEETIATPRNALGVYYELAPQVLEPVAINESGKVFYAPNGLSGYGGLGPDGPVLRPELKLIMVDGELCFFVGGCFESTSIKPAAYVDTARPSIDQELIFNGRTGDYVRFIYREISSSGLMRTPFAQEVQYDLSLENVIGFKGARLEILEATNQYITYRVLRPFDREN
jgi:hypothetical protein